ncbi:MAG: hypothetical protein HQL66_12670 [Magnetococcales bacterium]|nr:hypothetical protein [Magnetococcales bacterium]
MVDLFAIEPAIVACLENRLPEWHIQGAIDTQQALLQELPTRTILVINRGGQTHETAESAVLFRQNWEVCVAIGSVRDLRDGSAHRAIAGPVLDTLITLLHNWIPLPGAGPLRFAGAKPQLLNNSGRALFPLEFTVDLTRVGDDFSPG